MIMLRAASAVTVNVAKNCCGVAVTELRLTVELLVRGAELQRLGGRPRPLVNALKANVQVPGGTRGPIAKVVAVTFGTAAHRKAVAVVPPSPSVARGVIVHPAAAV